jgi:hypothetical protein
VKTKRAGKAFDDRDGAGGRQNLLAFLFAAALRELG